MKVGPGNFNDLDWTSAKAADVYEWAKKSEAEFTNWIGTLGNTITLTIDGKQQQYSIQEALEMVSGSAIATISGGADNEYIRFSISQNGVETSNATITIGEGLKGEPSSEVDGSVTFSTLSHADTSNVANVNKTDKTYIAGLTFDDFGHVLATETETLGDLATKNTIPVSLVDEFATEVAKVKVTDAGHADGATKVDKALTVKVSGVDVVYDGSVEKTANVDSAISTAIGDRTTYTNDEIDTAVQGAKDFAQGLVDDLPEPTDYTVTITEATDGLDAGIAKKYTFTQNGAEIGTINLAKELVVTAGSVKEVTEADTPYAGAKVGDKYIELIIANQITPIYVPAKDLVDIYTAKDGATEVQVAISNTNEISATLVNGGITEEKLHADVKTKLNKVWEEVGVAETKVNQLANGQVKTNTDAIAAINNAETGILAQAKTESANQAAAVLAEAQAYADQAEADALTAAKADAANLYEPKGTAQGIVDGLDLANTYQPKGDYASKAQGEAADTAVQTISTPVGTNNAPNGLKAVKTGTDVAISIDEDIVWVFNCGNATVI